MVSPSSWKRGEPRWFIDNTFILYIWNANVTHTTRCSRGIIIAARLQTACRCLAAQGMSGMHRLSAAEVAYACRISHQSMFTWLGVREDRQTRRLIIIKGTSVIGILCCTSFRPSNACCSRQDQKRVLPQAGEILQGSSQGCFFLLFLMKGCNSRKKEWKQKPLLPEKDKRSASSDQIWLECFDTQLLKAS